MFMSSAAGSDDCDEKYVGHQQPFLRSASESTKRRRLFSEDLVPVQARKIAPDVLAWFAAGWYSNPLSGYECNRRPRQTLT